MIDRPTRVDADTQQAFERHVTRLGERVDTEREAILNSVESQRTTDQLRNFVFSSNDALPKRGAYPALKICHFTDQLYRSHACRDDGREAVLRFAIVFAEYYLLVDDIFDGDIAQGREAEAFVTAELMQPLLAEYVHELGEAAVSYWVPRSIEMQESALYELQYEPSADRYLELLDRLSNYYSVLTGLAALVADGDEQDVQRAERIGSNYLTFEQFILDRPQFEGDDPDPWNIWKLLPEERVVEMLRSHRCSLLEDLAELPAENSDLIRPAVDVDIEAWRSSW